MSLIQLLKFRTWETRLSKIPHFEMPHFQMRTWVSVASGPTYCNSKILQQTILVMHNAAYNATKYEKYFK